LFHLDLQGNPNAFSMEQIMTLIGKCPNLETLCPDAFHFQVIIGHVRRQYRWKKIISRSNPFF